MNYRVIEPTRRYRLVVLTLLLCVISGTASAGTLTFVGGCVRTSNTGPCTDPNEDPSDIATILGVGQRHSQR